MKVNSVTAVEMNLNRHQKNERDAFGTLHSVSFSALLRDSSHPKLRMAALPVARESVASIGKLVPFV
jgi:hypothetical protein